MTTYANLIRSMAEAGASPEAIAIAVEALEQRDRVEEQRRAAARDKKRRQRAGQSRDSEGTNGDNPPSSPIPLDPPSQTLPPIIPQTPSSTSSPRKRAFRMPDDFQPDLDYAMAKGFSLSEAKAEVEKMRDWSKSSPNGAKLDWPATWRGWVSRAAERRSTRQTFTQQPRQTAFQQRHQSAIDAFDRKLGVSPDDQFTGSTIDLGNADWRPH